MKGTTYDIPAAQYSLRNLGRPIPEFRNLSPDCRVTMQPMLRYQMIVVLTTTSTKIVLIS